MTGGDALGTVGETTVVSWGSTQTPPGFQFQTSQSLDINSSPYSLDVTWDAALFFHHGQHARPAVGAGQQASAEFLQGICRQDRCAGGCRRHHQRREPGHVRAGHLERGWVRHRAPRRHRHRQVCRPLLRRHGSDSLAHELSPGTSFSYLYPNITGATAVVFVSGEANADGALVQAQVSAIALGTTNVSIALPSPISLIMPADSATNIGTDVDFSWTAVSGGNVVYTFEVQGPSGWYAVFTTATCDAHPRFGGAGHGPPERYGLRLERRSCGTIRHRRLRCRAEVNLPDREHAGDVVRQEPHLHHALRWRELTA